MNPPSQKNYDAGVKDYRSTYWEPEYSVKETDIPACFKVIPQAGVSREEAAAAVAAESSTGTWATVWTDLPTDLDHTKGRAYRNEDVPGHDDAFYAFIAYPADLFEEGSVVNVFTSMVGNEFGFKGVRSLRLEDLPFAIWFVKTCFGPPHASMSSATSWTNMAASSWAAPSSRSWVCRPRTVAGRFKNVCAAGLISPRMT